MSGFNLVLEPQWAELNLPYRLTQPHVLLTALNETNAKFMAWHAAKRDEVFGVNPTPDLEYKEIDRLEQIEPRLRHNSQFTSGEWVNAIADSAYVLAGQQQIDLADADKIVDLAKHRHRVANERETEMTWNDLPEMVEWRSSMKDIQHQIDNSQFETHPLNQPGVLIEVNSEKILIGNINKDTGECGCCTAIGGDTIVARALDLRELISNYGWKYV